MEIISCIRSIERGKARVNFIESFSDKLILYSKMLAGRLLRNLLLGGKIELKLFGERLQRNRIGALVFRCDAGGSVFRNRLVIPPIGSKRGAGERWRPSLFNFRSRVEAGVEQS